MTYWHNILSNCTSDLLTVAMCPMEFWNIYYCIVQIFQGKAVKIQKGLKSDPVSPFNTHSVK